MNFLIAISKAIDTLNEWIGRGVSWVTLGLVLVVFVDVVMRYLFKQVSSTGIKALFWPMN